MYINDWVTIQDIMLDLDNSYLEILIGSGFFNQIQYNANLIIVVR